MSKTKTRAENRKTTHSNASSAWHTPSSALRSLPAASVPARDAVNPLAVASFKNAETGDQWQAVDAIGRARLASGLQRALGNSRVSHLYSGDLQAKAAPEEGKLYPVTQRNNRRISQQPNTPAEELTTGAGLGFTFPLGKITTKGLTIGPVKIGREIVGELALSGRFNWTQGQTASTSEASRAALEESYARQLLNRLVNGIEWRGGGEIPESGGRLETGLDLAIFGGDASITLSTDITIFEIEGDEITFVAPSLTLTGAQELRVELAEGVIFTGAVNLSVSASVDLDWKAIARMGVRLARGLWRFVAKLPEVIAKVGPHLIVPAAILAWEGLVLYQIAEAHRQGRRWGLETVYAKGYGAALTEHIAAARRGSADWINEDMLALGQSKDRILEEAFELAEAAAHHDWGSTVPPEHAAARDRARLAGHVAATVLVDILIKTNGPSAWQKWCVERARPARIRQGLIRQALDHEPIIPLIEL